MATKYDRGRAFEYKVRDTYKDNGYYVVRSAGSKGKVDLVALKAGHRTHLIQCKAGAIASRERKEAVELHALAEELGCIGVLASKSKAGKLVLQYTADDAKDLETFDIAA